MASLKCKFIPRLSWIFPCLLAVSIPMQVLAQEAPAQETQEELVGPVQSDTFIYPLDAPRDYLSSKFVGWATSLDRFFGDDRDYQESNKSVIRLALNRVIQKDGDDKLVLSGRAKLHLPKTEEKLHILLETDPDKNLGEEAPKGSTTILKNEVATPSSYGAAVRYESKEESHWHYSTDAGIKFRGIRANPNPFVRARGSYEDTKDLWRLKIAESVFWFNSIGEGETTQLDLEYLYSDPILIRATSNVTWLVRKKNFDLRQDLSVYQNLNERTAVLYQGSVIGVSEPALQVTEYVLLALYRYRLHRDWVFFEISPQLHFPRDKNFESVPLLNLRLEMLFNEAN